MDSLKTHMYTQVSTHVCLKKKKKCPHMYISVFLQCTHFTTCPAKRTQLPLTKTVGGRKVYCLKKVTFDMLEFLKDPKQKD